MTSNSSDSRLLLLAWRVRHTFILPAIVFVFALLPGTRSYSQTEGSHITNNHYRAIFWTEADGLSLPKKNVMLKDINGFLWIISPVGLNRFDGNTFKIYHPDKNGSGKIGGSYTFSMVEDSLHNIWIGTNKGLSRYDIKQDTFKNFLPDTISITSVATVMPFWATLNEIYCLEAGYKIVMFNIHTLEKKLLVSLERGLPPINNINTPNSIYHAPSNSVWILSGEENSDGGGLMQVSLSDKKETWYDWPCPHKNEEHSHYSYNMQYDKKRNCIWINTVDGLFSFSFEDKQFHAIGVISDFMPSINYETISGLELDLQDNLWLHTTNKGIVIYNPVEKTLSPLFSDPVLQHKISTDNMSIYADRDGMVWCGYLSGKGICQLIPYNPSATRVTFPVIHSTASTQAPFTNMVVAGNDELWVGTAEGLIYRYHPTTGEQRAISKNQFHGITSKHIIPLAINRQVGKGWIASWGPTKLYELNLQTNQCKEVPFKDMNHKDLGGLHINLSTVRPYRNGFMFLVDKVGIFTVTDDSSVAQQVLEIPYHITNIALADEKKLFLRLHFSYTHLSYYEEEGKWIRTTTPLDNIEWFCIYHDKVDKSYWVGAVKQLHHLDSNFKMIRSYTEKDGLPGIDVICIQKDDPGNLWLLSSQAGLIQVNAKTDILTVLSEKDGYHKQSYIWLPIQLKDDAGDIYYTGREGIDRINPGKLDLFPAPTVYLQSLEVNQAPFPLSTGINHLQELSLEYFQNAVTFEIGVIDHYAQGKANIRYKLEGLHDKWLYASGNYRLRFERLPPGTYTLVIQASNSGNNFNGPRKMVIIKVNPAFWNTWVFRALTSVFVISVFYLLIRWRVQQKFRNRLERAEKERQLSDLKQKATQLEMQALRAQMNPHFIFNSLNSINRFIMQNDKVQASRYLTKFSKLVRLILQNSQAALISLESELESLELYLSLEALRFNHHFAYKISIGTNVDSASFKVPPLLLQPYVENAIWHGLMHKEEKGQLDIEVSRENNHLYFKISDNGVGRQHASALAGKSEANYKSLGLKITAQRIASLQHEGDADATVVINDLVHADGSAAGTEVTIKMPVIHA